MDSGKARLTAMIVIDKNGLQGTVIEEALDREVASTNASDEVLVRFQNGHQLLVPRAMLIHQTNERYSLPISVEDLSLSQSQGDAQSLVIPVIAEEVTVQKRVVETGITEIRKTVHERVERVDEPLQAQDVEIERVAVNRIVNEPLQIRYEGDTTIIPLLEEVLVVEKRLMLREEVHIKRVQREVHDPQDVLLQEEQVEIVRKPLPNLGKGQSEEPQ